MSDRIVIANLEFGDYVVLAFETQRYSLEMLEASALKFSDVAGFDIQSDDAAWKVTISAISASPTAQEIARFFANELIDQSLRAKIAATTATERNLILSFAFSNTKLVG